MPGQISEAFSTTVLPQASGIAIGAHAENDRRIPRRDAEHDADRLAHRHRDAARLVGRDHLAGDLRGHRRGLAQHAGGEMDVEAGPAGGRAGLAAISAMNCGALLASASAALSRIVRRAFGPVADQAGKAAAAASAARLRIGDLRRRGAGGDLAGHRD